MYTDAHQHVKKYIRSAQQSLTAALLSVISCALATENPGTSFLMELKRFEIKTVVVIHNKAPILTLHSAFHSGINMCVKGHQSVSSDISATTTPKHHHHTHPATEVK